MDQKPFPTLYDQQIEKKLRLNLNEENQFSIFSENDNLNISS